jgi:hypothetical protein
MCSYHSRDPLVQFINIGIKYQAITRGSSTPSSSTKKTKAFSLRLKAFVFFERPIDRKSQKFTNGKLPTPRSTPSPLAAQTCQSPKSPLHAPLLFS